VSQIVSPLGGGELNEILGVSLSKGDNTAVRYDKTENIGAGRGSLLTR
jgi:hypothetical protein